MKILFSIPSLHREGGGIVQVIPREAEELVRLGHEVRILTAQTSDYSDAAFDAEKNGVMIFRESIASHFKFGFRNVKWQYFLHLAQQIDWADIVHVNCLWMDASWITSWLCRWKGKRYVLQTHGALNPVALKKSAIKKWMVGHLIERSNLNHAAAVIATAESEKRSNANFGVKTPIVIIPIGIDALPMNSLSRDLAMLRKFGLDIHKNTLLYLARISPGKGLDLLAEAWSRLVDLHKCWQLLIVGSDDRGYTSVIKGVFSNLIKDGSVHFSGPIYGKEKFSLLKSVDAFVMPSRSENFNISVQEALSVGLPTVCSKGAPWSVLEEGAGYWVDVSVDAIQRGLRKMLTLSAAERAEMGRVGKKIIERDFQWPVVAGKLIEVYKRILEREC